MAQDYTKGAHRRQKKQYDQHTSGPVHPVGRRVWMHRPKASVGESAKLHRQWQIPYEVVYVRLPTVYVIQDLQSTSSDVLTAHYNQLKPAVPNNCCDPCDSLVSPRCIVIVEQTVENPPEGGPVSTLTNESTEDSAPAEGMQCNETETVSKVLK
ncbi:hypothetical protein PHET_12297 [Paragonimus heterotremus]|uniref:Uncharacterized protein n=1 Tax=Paragonimus heterotremus TaxID=100268 RepID=A0A8J4SY01_9TREM|nr:hypothetical protein PHET_12297 [Paragonimus heterotremus]